MASAVEQIAAGKQTGGSAMVAKLNGGWIHKAVRLAIYLRDGLSASIARAIYAAQTSDD